jgi:hypothetical protein
MADVEAQSALDELDDLAHGAGVIDKAELGDWAAGHHDLIRRALANLANGIDPSRDET